MKRTNVQAMGVALAAALAAAPARASDPTTAECLAANEKSIALRAEHRLQASRDQLLVCAAPSCPEDVRNECTRRLPITNAAIPTIVFDVKTAAGNDLGDVRISLDGAPLVSRLEGTAIPIDPGSHTFRFEAPGREAVEKTLIVHEGEHDRRERIVFGPSAGERPSAPAPEPPRSGGTRAIGLVAGAAGVVGLGLGTFFGLRAMSLWSSSQSECASKTSCAQHDQAVSDHDSAMSAATISTIGFLAGGAALAAGAWLFFTSPRAPAQSGFQVVPGVGTNAASIELRGRF